MTGNTEARDALSSAERIADDVLATTYDGRRLLSGSMLGASHVRRLLTASALAAIEGGTSDG